MQLIIPQSSTARSTMTFKYSKLLFTALSMLWLSLVHAEGGCPLGQYPQSGAGWNTCVPIPNYQQPQRSSGRPQPKWEDRWQAIATDAEKGSLGVATDALSQRLAEDGAVADCKSKGGRSCVIQAYTRNACLAMVVGANYMNFKVGDTQSKTDAEAKKACDAQDTDCAIYYSECSLPTRLQ